MITSALLIAVLHLSGPETQPVSECRPADAGSAFLIRKVHRMTTSDPHPVDAAVRDSLRLSAGTLPVLVTNNSVCRKARAAYEAALTHPGATFSGRVYTIQAGNRYVVLDPAYRNGDVATIAVFDSKWRMLSNFF